MKRTRKGFTLVELLIVIAVIGALAAMMTLASGDAAAKARAASVISGFKMVRTAVVMYEMDSADQGASLDHFNKIVSSSYVGPESLTLLQKYSIAEADGTWTASYTYGSGNTTLGTKIDDMGGDLGITAENGTAKMKVK